MTEPKLYELLYIIPNKYTEAEVEDIIKKIHGVVEKYEGVVKKTVNYGKRRFAYPIKHNHYGFYVLNHFEAEGPQAKVIDEKLRVEDEVLRHLVTIALPEGSIPEDIDLKQSDPKPKAEKPKAEPVARKKPSIADAKASDTEKEKMKKGTKFDIEKELGITAKEAEKQLEEVKTKEKEEGEGKVDLAELDKKLEEIMDDIEVAEEKKDAKKEDKKSE